MSEILSFFGNALLDSPASIVVIRRDRTSADAAIGVTGGQTVRTLTITRSGQSVDVAVYPEGSDEANHGLARAGVAVRHLLADTGLFISNMGYLNVFSVN